MFAVNGQSIHLGGGQTLTAGNHGIPPVDLPYFPGIGSFNLSNLRPWYWLILAIMFVVLFVNLRLRDSRLGRAWVALREDEVAAVSMGIPLVRTKLLAYAIGAAFGGMSGAFLGAYFNDGQRQPVRSSRSRSSSSRWSSSAAWDRSGARCSGRCCCRYINYYLIPDVFNEPPGELGLELPPDPALVRDLRVPARAR